MKHNEIVARELSLIDERGDDDRNGGGAGGR